MCNYDYDELVRFWCVVNPEYTFSMKQYMKREFMENIKPATYEPNKDHKSHDIACLRYIEADDLEGLRQRNDDGYSWGCYKALMMELCIVWKRWGILQYLFDSQQINRDVNHAIARLASDDSWKCLPVRYLVDGRRERGFYHNLTCIDEAYIHELR